MLDTFMYTYQLCLGWGVVGLGEWGTLSASLFPSLSSHHKLDSRNVRAPSKTAYSFLLPS